MLANVTGSLMTVEEGGSYWTNTNGEFSIGGQTFLSGSTVTAPIHVNSGGRISGAVGTLIVNTLNAGQDVSINGAPAVSFASLPYTYAAIDLTKDVGASVLPAANGGSGLAYEPVFYVSASSASLASAAVLGGFKPLKAALGSAVHVYVSVDGLHVSGTNLLVFRADDETNTNKCTCTTTCSLGTGNSRVICAGAAGTGCAFPATGKVRFIVDASSDCSTYPVAVGPLNWEFQNQ